MASYKAIELEKEPIRKLLLRYSLPGIIAMTVSSLYNLVDSIFIGQGCGSLALAGLTVAKPFMDICAAFGSLVGVGASTIVAIKLGEKKYKDANLVLGNIILLNIILNISQSFQNHNKEPKPWGHGYHLGFGCFPIRRLQYVVMLKLSHLMYDKVQSSSQLYDSGISND